jgi:N-glycosylase/DNA lyase
MKLNITLEDKTKINKVLDNFKIIKTEKEIFYNLCFCLMAPQTRFENNRKVIDKLIEEDFYSLPTSMFTECRYCKDALEKTLKPTRFYKNKTEYLLEAKKNFPEILKVVSSLDTWDNKQSIHVIDVYKIREYLVENVKGMGYKVSSHFLRNLGDTSLAILDVHIIKFLAEQIGTTLNLTYEEAVEYFKKIVNTKRGYLDLEKVFQNIAKESELNPNQLDAYLWKNYSKTSWEAFKY